MESGKSSRDIQSAPFLSLSVNPGNGTSTQRSLFQELPLIHQEIEGGFRETSDFLDLRQT